MQDRRSPTNQELHDEIKLINLRLDDYYKENFKYQQENKENVEKHHEENKQTLKQISQKIEPVVDLFNNTAVVARFTILLTKILAGTATLITIIYGALRIIKEIIKR